MKAFFWGLIFGIALTVVAVWYFGDRTSHTHATKDDIKSAAERAGDSLKNVATETKEFVQAKMESLNLTPEKIKDELARTGSVVRKKAVSAGQTIADATADARITGAIKAKLVADPNLSALSISVNTSGGLVTLAGTASSPANIQKAIQLAWDTEGVSQVVSTIQVKE